MNLTPPSPTPAPWIIYTSRAEYFVATVTKVIITSKWSYLLTSNKNQLQDLYVLWYHVLTSQLSSQGNKDRYSEISVQKCHRGHQRSNLQWHYIKKIHVKRSTTYVERFMLL